jgi:hypothetical protein
MLVIVEQEMLAAISTIRRLERFGTDETPTFSWPTIPEILSAAKSSFALRSVQFEFITGARTDSLVIEGLGFKLANGLKSQMFGSD